MADMAPNENCSGGDLGMNRDDDNQNMAGNVVMEAPRGGDRDANSKKKGYKRHKPHQIEELEIFFRECPHPDDNQRKALGESLGLDPSQIKFWFQNKRTQVKTLSERNETASLKAENDKLRAEVEKYKEALTSAICPNCGGPASSGEMSFDEQHLRMENARLREGMYGRGVGAHLRSLAFAADSEKTMIVELAVAAMKELKTLALDSPLWTPSNHGPHPQLNEEEYCRTFPRGIGPRLMGYKPEASRDSVMVIINHINLVEMLMDVNQWSKMFCGIVSRAATLEVLSTGVGGNYDGAMQMMSAEFQVPTPLVLTREYYFVRYCKQHPDGSWAVVDVSLDHLRPGATPRCRRRPSGCLIQELPNGHSKVTWIEHVEVDEKMLHNLYELVVNSGFAFGAKRWVASLERQVDRLASTMIPTITPGDPCGIYIMTITGAEGRKAMLTLAGRMMVSFCTDVGASTAHSWTSVGPPCDNIRVMIRRIMHDPGRPSGIVLCAATSLWLPVPPRRVFDFLRNESRRSQWDILSNDQPVSEIACIPNGADPGNCVSILRVHNHPNAIQNDMVIFQESCIDSTGSYVIYAPIDVEAMNKVLSGGNPNNVALLPSGFAILPDGPGLNDGPIIGIGSGGSLLTIAFQILVDESPAEKVSFGSVTSVKGLLKVTVEKIKAALMSGDTQHQI